MLVNQDTSTSIGIQLMRVSLGCTIYSYNKTFFFSYNWNTYRSFPLDDDSKHLEGSGYLILQSRQLIHSRNDSLLDKPSTNSKWFPVLLGYWLQFNMTVYFIKPALTRSITHMICAQPIPSPVYTNMNILHPLMLQYRHFMPAPVDRTSISAWLCKHP